jgi:protein CpxP
LEIDMRFAPLSRRLLVLSLACAASTATLAQPPDAPAGVPAGAPPCGEPGHGMHPVGMHPGLPGDGRGGPPELGPLEAPPPPFLRGLALSDEQQDRVFAITHELAPQLRQLARSAHKAHEQLHELSLGESYDEAHARSLAESGAKAEAELALLRLHADRQILDVLTPEQRKQATAQRAAFECGGPEGGHGRRGPWF